MDQMKRAAFQVETSSNEESEESEDSGHTTPCNIPVYESSNEEESENNSISREQESSETQKEMNQMKKLSTFVFEDLKMT
jgi:hypothetical protein